MSTEKSYNIPPNLSNTPTSLHSIRSFYFVSKLYNFRQDPLRLTEDLTKLLRFLQLLLQSSETDICKCENPVGSIQRPCPVREGSTVLPLGVYISQERFLQTHKEKSTNSRDTLQTTRDSTTIIRDFTDLHKIPQTQKRIYRLTQSLQPS